GGGGGLRRLRGGGGDRRGHGGRGAGRCPRLRPMPRAGGRQQNHDGQQSETPQAGDTSRRSHKGHGVNGRGRHPRVVVVRAWARDVLLSVIGVNVSRKIRGIPGPRQGRTLESRCVRRLVRVMPPRAGPPRPTRSPTSPTVSWT